MAGMIRHAALVLNELGNAGQRPDFGRVAGGHRSVQHLLRNQLFLAGRPAALGAGGPCAGQPRRPVLGPLPALDTHGMPMHAQPPGDLAVGQGRLKEFHVLVPPLGHRHMIPVDCHAPRRAAASVFVTLLAESQ